MDLSNTIITTKRLKLVPVSEEFAQDIFREFSEEITLYMFPRSPRTIQETLDYIHSRIPEIKSGKDFSVTILLKDRGEFIGGAGIHNLESKTPEFGIWIKKSAHGNKYGQEAIRGLKEWADKNIDYDYFIYPVDKKNFPSRKIAESLGGIIKRETKKRNQSGRILDEVEYWIYK